MKYLITLFNIIAFSSIISAQEIIYVDSSIIASGDGTKWSTAFHDLQEALATIDDVTIENHYQVWIAKGTYYPDSIDRNVSFVLKQGVHYYGGFDGIEGSIDERDLDQNQTILSGEIGDLQNSSDNSYHICEQFPSLLNELAVVNGITFEGGMANGFGIAKRGGAFNSFGGRVKFKECTFRNNVADEGGALFDFAGLFIIEDCSFISNRANIRGGAIQFTSQYELIRCSFQGNYGQEGGALYLQNLGLGYIINSKFFNNMSFFGGGAISFKDCTHSSLVINCVFSENDTNLFAGQAMTFRSSNGAIMNCTFTMDNADQPNFIYNSSKDFHPSISNSIFWNFAKIDVNTKAVDHSFSTQFCISNGFIFGPGNNQENPFFMDADGADNILGTTDDDFRLSPISPAIDQGINSLYNHNLSDTDILGNDRIFNSSGDSIARIDIGAVEYQSGLDGQVIYVDSAAQGLNNGTDWENAFIALYDAIHYLDTSSAFQSNGPVVEIWIAEGTYHPTDDDDRFKILSIKKNVNIVGGFAHGESSKKNRNFEEYKTTISGNIGHPDSVMDNSTNLFEVAPDTGQLFVSFDGVELSDVYQEQEAVDANGGLISSNKTSLFIVNSCFASSFGTFNGGAIYSENGRLFVCNSRFQKLRSLIGGSIHTDSSELQIYRSEFSQNYAWRGGAIANRNSVRSMTINRCIFQLDSVRLFGGAIETRVPGTIQNCLFVACYSGIGAGAIHIRDYPLEIVNCTFYGNKAEHAIGAINSSISLPIKSVLRNSLIWASGAPSFPNTYGVTIASGNIIEDSVNDMYPQFNDTLGADSILGTSDDDFSLKRTSPAIDFGRSNNLAGAEDLAGNDRNVDYYPGDNIIDAGAYEYQAAPVRDIIFVDENAIGNNDGSDWPNAFNELYDGLHFLDTTAHTHPRDIWVKQGTYKVTNDADRDKSITLLDSVNIIGGFTRDVYNKNHKISLINKSTITGNIGNENLVFDNSKTIIRADTHVTNVLLESFIFQDAFHPEGAGGGVISQGQNIQFRFCDFEYNFAHEGAGAYHFGGISKYFNCEFRNNFSTTGNVILNTDGSQVLFQHARIHK